MSDHHIWYHIYPLGFLRAETENPAPGSDVGDVTHRLPELVGWLDYLVDLGITGVLLGPVFESETHGYDVVDPYRVDRRLGTEADLAHLIDECHRRSFSVALDAVYHHVGRGHPHFRDVSAHRDQSAWRDWFHLDFHRHGHDGFHYANFEGHDQLVKLNHANPQVLEWAVDVADFWIERGVDGFRIDAAYAIPTSFLTAFADRVCARRADVFLVGEMIHGDYNRFARETRLTTLTQYELWKAIWSSLNDGNFFELAHALERHGEYCQHYPPWNFVGNHDTTRIATKLADRRHLFHAITVLFAVPGIPTIYAGDEQGAEGTKYDRAGGDTEVRLPPLFRPGQIAGQHQEIWQQHRDLIAIRRARPWLGGGSLHARRLENRSLMYEVCSGEGRLVVALNIEKKPVKFDVPREVRPAAGCADSLLPPHEWGVWASP